LQYGYVFRKRKRNGECIMIGTSRVVRTDNNGERFLGDPPSNVVGVRVFLPEGVGIPEDWDSWTMQAKDEWLFENQDYVNYKWKDVDRGDVVQIQELR
jgi:hypothetical protein